MRCQTAGATEAIAFERVTERHGQVILYSVGPDGVDDEGRPFDPETKKGDQVFVLRGEPADDQPGENPAPISRSD